MCLTESTVKFIQDDVVKRDKNRMTWVVNNKMDGLRKIITYSLV